MFVLKSNCQVYFLKTKTRVCLSDKDERFNLLILIPILKNFANEIINIKDFAINEYVAVLIVDEINYNYFI